MITADFLPVSREDMIGRGWYYYDFLLVTGDAYVDHPSFSAAVIGRTLEAEGYRVAVLPQPPFRDSSAIADMGRPRYAALVTAGNLDSMVAHYTAARKPRSEDFYSPGKKAGRRPDRAVIVYSKLIREAFNGLPVIIGGLEASLRRFAHYDYWDDSVRRPVLIDSDADMIVYGMGESAIIEVARRIASKEDIKTITDVRGTGYATAGAPAAAFPSVECASFEEVCKSKRAYAKAAMLQLDEHDHVRGRTVVQRCGDRSVIINPMAYPLAEPELDRIFGLPFTREVHPMYLKDGGVPAIEEVRFSVIHNRGCFGNCNFCALAFHQGRSVTSRSHDSVIREVRGFLKHPEFKGYVHDVGGPTANFRRPSCKLQEKNGLCKTKSCLAAHQSKNASKNRNYVPSSTDNCQLTTDNLRTQSADHCPNIDADHTDYLRLLRRVAAIPGIKKVFVRSGIRFDYLMLDKNGEFFAELVKNHISGQLKVAPEHCIDSVLHYMGKPGNAVFERFVDKYKRLNERYGKEQYLVPYLISSHPGSKTADAIALAEYLNRTGRQPEQVQDFYPTPGTLSTCMYYTGLDPRTMKPIYVPRSPKDKAVQRALLQWKKPENRSIVRRILREAGRGDLVGFGKHCLIRPEKKK